MARGLALIVDDSSTARIILSRVLGKIDIVSTGYATAEQALQQLQQGLERPDVIFLDHLLPGMDGFQALRELKRLPVTRDIPVFMYTSQGADRYVEEARALGAAGVIGKQVDRDQLYNRLAGILARQYSDVEAPTQSLPTVELDSETAPRPPAEQGRQLRRLTGRLSTLEIAYEEANDELRHFRQELAALSVENSHLQRQQRRGKWVSGFLIFGVLALGFMQVVQFAAIEGALLGIQAQFRDIEAVVSALVDLNRS